MQDSLKEDFEKERAEFNQRIKETDKFIEEQQVRIKELEAAFFALKMKEAGSALIKAYKVLNNNDSINAIVWTDEDPFVKYELSFKKL